MNFDQITNILQHYPPFRLKQVNDAIFKNLIDSWQNSNLPRNIKEELCASCSLHIRSEMFISEDKRSIKALITLDDETKIESVLMRYENARNAVCVSSQVGCPLRCVFCTTGDMGFTRNLNHSEIIQQVLLFQRYLKKEKEKVTNIVFMGMGEPFLNYGEVMESIKILNDPKRFGIGQRKISVSTSGLVEGIEKFGHEGIQVNLAVSLHASNNFLRSRLMPINEKHSLPEILDAVSHYIQKTKRKVMIEYLLLDGINDSPHCARELSQVLKKSLGRLFMVNLIAYNDGKGAYRSSCRENITKFRKVLEESNIEVTQRFRLGRNIKGGCGQLIT